MIDYLTTGAGRYAVPSSAKLVQKFFADSVSATPLLAAGTNTVAQIQTALSVTGGLGITVSNYLTDGGSSDYMERACIFGGSGFRLADTMTFTVDASGNYTINNIELIARQNDFDFQSANSIATVANNIHLIPALDPYGLIPRMRMEIRKG
jgi:hypothetical protein